MKWLKSFKVFESNIEQERVDELLDTIQYFLEDEDIFKSKQNNFGLRVSKELVNEWIHKIEDDKLIIIILMNNDLYPTNDKREKIYTLEDKLKKSFIPMIEEKTKIEILEQKIDSWNFVPTGIRIEIEL